MSSKVPTKRERPTNSLPSGKGLSAWLSPIFSSSVGGKFLVAITGLCLVGFVIVHMLGNLQIFAGPEALNAYAHKLKDMGPLLWIARIVLLTIFVVHIWVSVRLTLAARAARPIGYAHERTVQASIASRTMIYSGLLILAFVIFHIAHYTLGIVQYAPPESLNGQRTSFLELRDPQGHQDVYRMTIIGFSNPIIAVLYVIAQLVLLLHLSHGVASTFQTLGLNTPRTQPAIRIFGWAIALLVVGGNIAIVLAVFFGAVK